MPELERHWRYLEGEWEAAKAAPLSQRKAMLVALLIDAFVDRLFAAQAAPGDVLAFRQEHASRCPALGLVMDLVAQRGPRLVTEAVTIALEDYTSLAVGDFMVSLYNNHSVQQLRLLLPDGGRLDMHQVLAEAMEAVRP